MTPRGLVLLLIVGLCAAQLAQAGAPASRALVDAARLGDDVNTLTALEAHARYERGVKELLATAKAKLLKILVNVQDAARASVETVWKYYEQLEAQVLEAGTEKLFSYGLEVNLTSIAVVVKKNAKTCTHSDRIIKQGKALLTEYAVCITSDVESLKSMISNMRKLWATAQAMPTTMAEVAKQCRGIAGTEGAGDLLTKEVTDDSIHDALAAMSGGDPFALLKDSQSVLAAVVDQHVADAAKEIVANVVDDALAEFTEDVDAHDLAEKANELLLEASKTMNKRQMINFGRITKCVKAVYSLSKSDLVTVPGQIMAATSNAYRVYQAAQSGITTCVSAKVPASIPAIITITVEFGVCVAETNVDDMIAKYPSMAGLKKIIELAEKIAKIKDANAGDIDFVPKAIIHLLPPSVQQAIASANQAFAVYQNL